MTYIKYTDEDPNCNSVENQKFKATVNVFNFFCLFKSNLIYFITVWGNSAAINSERIL